MGVCVPDFRYICLAFRLARSRDTHKYTRIQGKLEISSTGCSPHVDFENTFFNLFDFLYQKREMTPLFHFIFPFHVVWAIWKKIQPILSMQKEIVTSFCQAFWEFLAILIRFLQNKTVKLKEIQGVSFSF